MFLSTKENQLFPIPEQCPIRFCHRIIALSGKMTELLPMTKMFVLLGTCGEILPWVKFSVLLNHLLLLILSGFIRKIQNVTGSSFTLSTAQKSFETWNILIACDPSNK